MKHTRIGAERTSAGSFRRRPAIGSAALLAAVLLAVFLPNRGAAAETYCFGGVTADGQTEYVDLGEERIEDWDAFYAFLSGLPCLKRADLFATPIRAERIGELHERFPGVSFGMTMLLGDHMLRTDATAFSTLHSPYSSPHDEKELSLVRYCTGLYALDLGHNRLEDLSFLHGLPELRVLIVAMNQISDISVLGQLRHLEYLEIFNNSVRDVSCLAGLPYLTDLNLTQNRIDDLSPVSRIGSLRRLWMGRYDTQLKLSQITETAKAVQAALPGCLVDAVSPSVGGDWRTHPHYETIRRIFASGVYEPFSDSPPENIPPGF